MSRACADMRQSGSAEHGRAKGHPAARLLQTTQPPMFPGSSGRPAIMSQTKKNLQQEKARAGWPWRVRSHTAASLRTRTSKPFSSRTSLIVLGCRQVHVGQPPGSVQRPPSANSRTMSTRPRSSNAAPRTSTLGVAYRFHPQTRPRSTRRRCRVCRHYPRCQRS